MKINAIQNYNLANKNNYSVNKKQSCVSFRGEFLYNEAYDKLLSAQAAEDSYLLAKISDKYLPLLKKCKGTYEFREEGSHWLHTVKKFDYGLYKDNKLLATGYVLHMPEGISTHIRGMVETLKESIIGDLGKGCVLSRK